MAASKSKQQVMLNPYVSIVGQVFKQRDGSPIGLDLSVKSASIYVSLLDRDFLEKIQ